MNHNQYPKPHGGMGDQPPATQQPEGPFGFQFFNPQNHDSALSFPDPPPYFQQPYRDHYASIPSEDRQILQPEPKRPRHYSFHPPDPSSVDFAYVSSPESVVPNHQILPSQRDTHTPGVTSSSPATHDPQLSALALSWGSDPSFGPEGYSPHPDTPSHDAMENSLTELYMSWVDFSVEESADATDADRTLLEMDKPGRRRKSFREGGGDGGRPSSRRRLQHILSERNRRTQQSKLYDEICALVPGVCPKRRRKSEVLMRAAEWLEELTEGNRRLMEQLEHLNEDDE
ncbi:hypothetical protein BJX63DRAFT_377798 [Aspergillus granulosus]|uniref:BHLH domain-containing protein n=1 Tax=Aspergillus granulosus TaxID=176169 RepID=A0ABR4I5A7_9EURO